MGRQQALATMKAALRLPPVPSRATSKTAHFELRPLQRFDDVVHAVIGRLKLSAAGRRGLAQKALGDLADQAFDRENRP